jgi:hypothetical protein
MLKYSLGEKVRIVRTGRVAEVFRRQLEDSRGNSADIKKYFVQYENDKKFNWYDEEQLIPLNQDAEAAREIINKSLKLVDQQIIDHLLDERDFDGLRDLHK